MATAKRILILEPPGGGLHDLVEALNANQQHELAVQVVSRADELLHLVAMRGCDVVLLDCHRGDGDRSGLDLLAAVRELDREVPVIAVAEKGDVETARRAVGAGATDFLVRGAQMSDRIATLLGKLDQIFHLIEQNQLLREQYRRLGEDYRARYQIVGESPAMIELLERVRRVAAIPRPVLITGDRGTGKELIARAIHLESGRAGKPMISVNCAALPDELLESELFGHEKGAFTGALGIMQGKFELADGGTLFLDEIGQMSLAFQQKILRVVEYGVFARVGGNRELRTTARMVTATNMDLRERIRAGEFLADLYDRLSFEVLHVPALRERGNDVELLAHHILHQFMREIHVTERKTLSNGALAALRRYSFPGNVRELKNIIERAVYRETGDEITAEDLGLPSDTTEAGEEVGTYSKKVAAYKRRLVTEALREASGNQAEAARKLGLSYHQLRYLVRKSRL